MRNSFGCCHGRVALRVLRSERMAVDNATESGEYSREPVLVLKGGGSMPQANVVSTEMLTSEVRGPDGANRLFTCVGEAASDFYLPSGHNRTETWTFLVGPTFAVKKFHRAVGTGSISRLSVNAQQAPMFYGVGVENVDSDWDDESGQVNVRIELWGSAGNSVTMHVYRVRYAVTILGEA